MLSFNTTVLVKLMLVGLVSFALLLSVSSLYVGPRYGKRLPYDNSRLALRSSSPRTIQSRSQVRFYAGSRYGGKRSYWEPSMPESEIPGTSTDFLQHEQQLQQQQQQQRQTGNISPFDCIYVPYVGVRCLPARRMENPWSNVIGESEEESGSPNNSNILSGNPSASATGGSDTS